MTSSDQAPLWVALGLPCAAVMGLFAWVGLSVTPSLPGLPLAEAKGPGLAAILVLLASALVYGTDRWRDSQSRSWGWIAGGVTIAGLEILMLSLWWSRAEAPSWISIAFYAGGQLLALSYAGVGAQGKGLKHLPGGKALVVAVAVSVACVGMHDAFSSAPALQGWWGRAEVQSAAAFVLGVSGCNALLFDLRDLDRDARAGVPSLPVLWGRERALYGAGLWLAAWVLVSMVWPGVELETGDWWSRAAGLGAGLWQVGRRYQGPVASRYFLTLDGALVVPWLVLLWFRVWAP